MSELSRLRGSEGYGVCDDDMWLSRREMRYSSGEAPAEDGVVTLAGEETAVYAQGERRRLPVYGPGGCCWRPAVGDRVLVLKLGQESEQCCVAGMLEEAPEELKPGELVLRSRGGAEIWLKNVGTVEITGEVKINGEKYQRCICYEDTKEESGGEA